MDDIDQLTSLLDFPLPAKLRHIRPELTGPAFFPAGTGILRNGKPGRSLPQEGVMCLGHNFSNVEYYEKIKKNRGENLTTNTWGQLLPFLDACGIEIEECFFTNALMGIMDSKSNLKAVDDHQEEAFRADCLKLFRAALVLQRPRLVLALGKGSIRFLGEAFPQNLKGWEGLTDKKTFDLVDRTIPGGPVRHRLPLPDGSGGFSVVALTHPVYRMKPTNAAMRRFRGRMGEPCELAMVAEGRGNPALAASILAGMDSSSAT